MGLLDKLLGRAPRESAPYRPAPPQSAPAARQPLDEDQAIARYRYLMRTAPPEAIERVHQEAFARLTPQQRAHVLRDLSERLPDYERASLRPENADPNTLARLATRAEIREPGIMERMFGRWRAGGPAYGGGHGGGYGGGYGGGGFGGGGFGGGFGGMGGPSFGTTLLGSFLTGFAGSMVANQLFEAFHDHDGGVGQGFTSDAGGFQGGEAAGFQGGDAVDADHAGADDAGADDGGSVVEADYDPSADADVGGDAFGGDDFGGGGDFGGGFGDDFDV